MLDLCCKNDGFIFFPTFPKFKAQIKASVKNSISKFQRPTNSDIIASALMVSQSVGLPFHSYAWFGLGTEQLMFSFHCDSWNN